jgi:phosphoribosylanthranilate isomerase
MKVKICGLMRSDDALFAAECGADFLGLIFAPASPRFMHPEDAAKLVATVRARHEKPKFVGVFRNAANDYIRDVASIAGLDLVQLHGHESEAQVAELNIPVIKAVSVGSSLPEVASYPSAQWLLFDTLSVNGGGAGRTFDWSLLEAAPRPAQPFLLAGGLDPDNVADAIARVRPDGIDLASGVESAPGVKDHAKLRLLFERLAS